MNRTFKMIAAAVLLIFSPVLPARAGGSFKTIAMVGDSLTKGGRSWKVLGHPHVLNFGINGAKTSEILGEMDQVIEAKPDLVFVMAGINDINQGKNLKDIFNNYKSILRQLQEAGIATVVESTLYTAGNRPERKEKIKKLNLLLEKFAAANKMTYLDLTPYLCENQKLRPEYDYDGLHVNYQGYLVWADQIKKRILNNDD